MEFGPRGMPMSRAAPSKTACVQSRPYIQIEEMQFCIEEQKMCHKEVWTRDLKMLITADPYLTLCLIIKINIGNDRGEVKQ